MHEVLTIPAGNNVTASIHSSADCLRNQIESCSGIPAPGAPAGVGRVSEGGVGSGVGEGAGGSAEALVIG